MESTGVVFVNGPLAVVFCPFNVPLIYRLNSSVVALYVIAIWCQMFGVIGMLVIVCAVPDSVSLATAYSVPLELQYIPNLVYPVLDVDS
jgi:hypothetical protein